MCILYIKLYLLNVFYLIFSWTNWSLPYPLSHHLPRLSSYPCSSPLQSYLPQALRAELCTALVTRLTPVLHLLHMFCTPCTPSYSIPPQDVLEAVAEFLRLNHSLLTFLLRLRIHSLAGIRLTTAVVHLLGFVAYSPYSTAATLGTAPSPSKLPRTHWTPSPSSASNTLPCSLWEAYFGRSDGMSDLLTTDICALLKLFGKLKITLPTPTSTFFEVW